LKTNRGILISRLIYNKSKRPLLADKTDSELLKFINELIDKREPFYLKAKITFQMDKSKLDELIYAIIHAENECIK
jgi:shikimate kinase